jgi:nucleotide-binding universal stress UspA family protein
MLSFSHILFPVDFSDHCRTAIPFVKWMAGKFDARVTLINVIELPLGGYWGIEGAYPITYDLSALSEDAMAELGAFWDDCTDSPVIKIVKVGNPGANIVDYAGANGVDLIMLPTHGWGTFRRLLLGSVTAQVLHDAKCSVWTAAHSTESDSAKHLNCRNILCAIDLAPEGVSLIRSTQKLASELAARPLLLHAVPGAVPQPAFPAGNEFQRFLLNTAEREIKDLQARAETNMEVVVKPGPVAETVRTVALDRKSDLIAIGRGRLHENLGGLRSNAYNILREAPCPVISFP